MKKLVLVIVVILLLSGCAAKTKAPYEELAYLRYPETFWGMTPEEFLAAMGDEAEDYTISEEHRNESGYLYYRKPETEFLGETYQIQAEFNTGLLGEECILNKITLARQGIPEREAFEKSCGELEALLQKEGYSFTSQLDPLQLKWEAVSQATTGALPPEHQEKATAFYQYAYEQLEWPIPNPNSYRQFSERPLSSVSLVCYEDAPATVLTFSGAGIWSELAHANMCDRLGLLP